MLQNSLKIQILCQIFIFAALSGAEPRVQKSQYEICMKISFVLRELFARVMAYCARIKAVLKTVGPFSYAANILPQKQKFAFGKFTKEKKEFLS